MFKKLFSNPKKLYGEILIEQPDGTPLAKGTIVEIINQDYDYYTVQTLTEMADPRLKNIRFQAGEEWSISLKYCKVIDIDSYSELEKILLNISE